MSIFRGIDACLKWFEKKVLAWSILLMAAISIGNVISRNVFDESWIYAEEISQLLIILVTFIGTSYAARIGTHIRMAAIYDQMERKGRKIMMSIVCAGTAFVMFYLTYLGYLYVAKLYMMGRVSPALRVPMYLFYMWVPIGFFMTGIQYSVTLVLNLVNKSVYLGPDQIDNSLSGEEVSQAESKSMEVV